MIISNYLTVVVSDVYFYVCPSDVLNDAVYFRIRHVIRYYGERSGVALLFVHLY